MESKIKFKPNSEYRLMDQVREVLLYCHYSYRTDQSYSSWIFQYIKFFGGKTHPKYMTLISFLYRALWRRVASLSQIATWHPSIFSSFIVLNR